MVVCNNYTGLTYLENVLATLALGVDDLSMVNDNGVTASTAFLISPADTLRELGLRVRQEKLLNTR